MSKAAMTLEDLKARVGTEVRVTDWFFIDQRTEDVFSFLIGDPDEKHNDPEWSRNGPFGGTVVHGYFQLALTTEAWKKLGLPLATTEEFTPVNYGLDRVRFPAPLRVGQRARYRIAVDDVTIREDGSYLVKARFTMEAEGSEKPCLVAEKLFLFLRLK